MVSCGGGSRGDTTLTVTSHSERITRADDDDTDKDSPAVYNLIK
jgi:hypothetical protein